MKTVFFVAIFSMFVTTPLLAETWIAVCNDGQRLQYNQVRGGEGSLILKPKVGIGAGQSGGIVVARLKQTSASDELICGTIIGSRTGRGGHPVTQICANKRGRSIFIRYKHPYENRPLEGRAFCEADVTVR